MRSSWDQNWNQIKQSGKEYFLDVHAVADNFLGSKGWKWLREDKPQEESRWERFKEEMMEGARFYSNDSYISDRFWLGVGATVYTIPYFTYRLFYDGVQTTYEYGTYRLTGETHYLFEHRERAPNSHLFALPLSAFFVSGMVATEAGLRIMGGSSYGLQIIEVGSKRALNLLNRYTGYEVDEKGIPPLNILSPKTAWDAIDRLSLITIPGQIAAIEMGLASIVLAVGTTLENTARVAGLTNYGFNRLKYAHMVAINQMQRYTGFSYTTQEFKAQAAKQVMSHNLDKYALIPHTLGILENIVAGITGAGIRIGEEIVVRSINAALTIGEGALRTAGFSNYGQNFLFYNHMKAAKQLSRYFTPYSSIEMEQQATTINKPATSWMDKLDRIALFPRVIGFVEQPLAIGLSGALRIGEEFFTQLYRILKKILTHAFHFMDSTLTLGENLVGLSEYGMDIIEYGHMQALKKFERYFSGYSDADMKAKMEKLARPAVTWTDACARIALLPRLISNMERVAASALYVPVRITEEVLNQVYQLVRETLKIALNIAKGTTHLLGLSDYGYQIFLAAHMRSTNLLSRYTGITYSTQAIAENQEKLTAKCKTTWDLLDRCSYVTFPGLISLMEMMIAMPIAATLRLSEAAVRSIGISEKSVQLGIVSLSLVGNMYGVSHRSDFEANKKALLTTHSGWDAFNYVGLVTSGSLIAVVSTASAIPPFIGLSKSNWHRFNHFRHEVTNDINERRMGTAVDRTYEKYHAAELAQSETTSLGALFSHVNLLNMAETAVMGVVRYGAAPLTYAGIRFVKDHGFGLIPLFTMCSRPLTFDLNNPFDRIKKRFQDLQNALNEYGYLPRDEKDNNLRIPNIKNAANEAENRTCTQKLRFGLFSEGRKILSLGHTEEEKVLGEFQSKFDEFARICKRNKVNNANAFFTQNITLPRGDKFSFEAMVTHIEGTYSSQEQKKRIQSIAQLIRTDIEKEMKEPTNKFFEVNSRQARQK